ncbi:putative NADPH-dependent methylglyoxal reductase Grp2p [[Candida] jaroonii]|uniref:NADPH-dependent methylglyoxal reductase Grp2p n=1 Tax=[Candida] jaroonii TaxID=467808 RepID=A0ACA9YD11_9ASCO|nr:putative NADPH-dependent methylglyoxal reductase Grp2p [[Candida] jaroonii]
MMETVLLTGSNGFLGSHLVKKLLSKYKVIGTVRSKDKGENLVQELKQDSQLNIGNFQWEIWELTDQASLEKILKKYKISKIVHSAAPYDFGIKNFVDNVINPIIKGMEILISVIKTYPVTHFVLTSSSQCHYNLDQYSNEDFILTEKTWCSYNYEEAVENPFKAYHYAKTQSEILYWNFINSSASIIGCAISPFFMFGPQPFDSRCLKRLNTPNELFNIILRCGPDDLSKIPNLFGYVSDVRDIAELHFKALEHEKLQNKILLPFSGIFSCAEILNLAKDSFRQLNLPPKTFTEIILFKVVSNTNGLIDFELTNPNQTIFDSLNQIVLTKNL